jgi:hypothetical protein
MPGYQVKHVNELCTPTSNTELTRDIAAEADRWTNYTYKVSDACFGRALLMTFSFRRPGRVSPRVAPTLVPSEKICALYVVCVSKWATSTH